MKSVGKLLVTALVGLLACGSLAGCKGTSVPPYWGGGDTDTDTDIDTDVDADTDVPADCDNPPAPDVGYTIINGPKATEDFAFDDEGNMIAAANGNLFKSRYDGTFELFMTGAGGFIAGLRALPNGDIVYSDVDTGTIFRVDKDTAAKTPVLSGLEYSNGIEIGLDGFIYTAEQSGNRVRRINPDTGEYSTVAEGLSNPNGLSFSPNYETLYIGSFGGGTIWKVDIDSDGEAGPVEIFASNVGTGALDGMGVDACGNVYVCDYGAIIIYRISPDGLTQDPIVNLSADSSWIPNFQWGSGIGGWDENKFYVLDMSHERVYEVPVELPCKYKPYP